MNMFSLAAPELRLWKLDSVQRFRKESLVNRKKESCNAKFFLFPYFSFLMTNQ